MNGLLKKALVSGAIVSTLALGTTAFAQTYGGPNDYTNYNQGNAWYGDNYGYGNYNYPQAQVHSWIYNHRFHPYTIYVRRGTTVTWTNYDYDPHTVTSYYGGFSSGQLDRGESYSHTFWRRGVYCQIHPYMHGRVVVY